ncbi:30S ribosomal protein S16 [Mycoplasma putrefaciens Mput9231]|uniref:Small ribosomal subunit protein bS16 n=1 Tax=Mycoplasma putrefaciens Mput9231 TaxID=1292033 RepID=M9W9K4_9MOLU|nr:30S ribosomal protein S16 [Mycoplasma putrefaciens Mput9231]
MVKLRLKRIGKKQAPFYRIVAADSRVNRNGKYIELVGTFNPLNNEVKIDKDLTLKWLQNGAQPTDTVRTLLSQQGILKALHESKQANSKPKAQKPVKEAKPTAKKPTTKSTAAKKSITKSTTTKSTAAKKPSTKKATTTTKKAVKEDK